MGKAINEGASVLHILTGADEFSRAEALSGIKNDIGEPEMLSANTVSLDGRQLTVTELRAAAATVPFLAPRRLVIVTGLLERFESRPKAGARSKAGRKGGDDEILAWVEALTGLPETTELVLVEGKLGGRNPLLPKIATGAKQRSFPLLNRPQLRQWIGRRVDTAGGKIEGSAVELLVRLVGSNLWVMNQELEKLRLFVGERAISETDVRQLVGASQELSIFNVVDAIVELKSAAAGESLQGLLDRGATPAHVMVMLTRQFRMIIRFKELQGQRLTDAEIQKRLGLASDFVFQKTRQQAGQYSRARLREIYHRLLETDLAIKTGRFPGEMALNILIAELCGEAPGHD